MTENGTTSKRKPVAAKKMPVARKATAAKKPAPVKAEPAKKQKKKEKKAVDKPKVVRDSFTMPQADYDKIAELKQTCLKAGVHVKKSELLRAGLHALGKLSAAQLKQAIARMEPVKAGRPKKS